MNQRPHTRVIGDLSCTALNDEQASRTGGNYRYLVQVACTPHTAFTTRPALERWLSERGLRCDIPTAVEPEHYGQGRCSHAPIVGSYARVIMWDKAEFYDLPAVVRTRTQCNGDWVEAHITEAADGMRVVHTLNPNVRDRRVFAGQE